MRFGQFPGQIRVYFGRKRPFFWLTAEAILGHRTTNERPTEDRGAVQ